MSEELAPVPVVTSSTTISVTEDPAEPSGNVFVSVYDNNGVFTGNIQYKTQTGGPALTIELVSYNSPVNGFAALEFDDYTIRISGTALNMIPGGFYKFLMPDKTIKILPADTQEDFDTIVEWSPPPIKVIEVTHTLQIRIIDPANLIDSVVPLNITQEIYWKYEFGLQSFRDLLQKGRL